MSNKLIDKRYDIVKYSKKNDNIKITASNYIHHDQIYNLKQELYEKLRIKDIANILIHSYILNVYCTEEELIGIYVTTKERMDKGLYYIKYEQFREMLNARLQDK